MATVFLHFWSEVYRKKGKQYESPNTSVKILIPEQNLEQLVMLLLKRSYNSTSEFGYKKIQK